MCDTKYLYGASVQGIQDFIFKTSKLREIIGASELVEKICTSLFMKIAAIQENDKKNIILNAAGNIKYIFEKESACQAFVKEFPKEVMTMAPGITISQAVVRFPDNSLIPPILNLPDAINALEKKIKTQRNKPSMPHETGFMGLERSRRTGGVAIEDRKNHGVICEASKLKIDSFGHDKEEVNILFEKVAGKKITNELLAADINEITESGNNAWLAVIHADGNAVGKLVQSLAESLKLLSSDKQKSAFSDFSKALDQSTKEASKAAFKAIMVSFDKLVREKGDKRALKYPLRPILLGGDDITLIIRADLALEFTKVFLAEFEKQTEKNFSFLKTDFNIPGFEKGITASAGIAYFKKAYPLHYALHLADLLCADAKQTAKKNMDGIIPKSTLAFYKVQESFIEDLETLKNKTLKAVLSDVDFAYGPYLLHKIDSTSANLTDLEAKLQILANHATDKSKSVSKLRKWISELYNDSNTADLMMKRFIQIAENKGDSLYKDLNIANWKENKKTIIYDLVQLHSLKY